MVSNRGRIISVFSHKGGVGKTTFVFNLGYQLARDGARVLLVDADPQMNLSAAAYGKSMDIDYSHADLSDEDLNRSTEDSIEQWRSFREQYRNFDEHFNHYAQRDIHTAEEPLKPFYRAEFDASVTLDLLAGSIELSSSESTWYDIVMGSRGGSAPRDPRVSGFRKSLDDLRPGYDFVLVDTPPSASSVITAITVSESDYFIVPTTPNFFSLQAINNLHDIVEKWDWLLDKHRETPNTRGLSLKSRFLGFVVNRSKKFQHKSHHFAKMTRLWSAVINKRLDSFIRWSFDRKRTVTEHEFRNIFGQETCPFLIQNIAQFPDNVAQGMEVLGTPSPVLMAIAKSTELKSKAGISLSSENIATLAMIEESYQKISHALRKNLQ
jgi:chromosome partitioning protein